ncbi:hypothetical protein EDB83DRAFT_2317371 [Lactarius deliciosus]|nr:hypothetical protein EDB83DRAFT_2317371 [Lactarius deliciosus]
MEKINQWLLIGEGLAYNRHKIVTKHMTTCRNTDFLFSLRIAGLALDRYWTTTCNALSMKARSNCASSSMRAPVSRSRSSRYGYRRRQRAVLKAEPDSSRFSRPGLCAMCPRRSCRTLPERNGCIGSHDFEQVLDGEFALRWGGDGGSERGGAKMAGHAAWAGISGTGTPPIAAVVAVGARGAEGLACVQCVGKALAAAAGWQESIPIGKTLATASQPSNSTPSGMVGMEWEWVQEEGKQRIAISLGAKTGDETANEHDSEMTVTVLH